MFSMLKAVHHLAVNGIMHRDIKPSNFLYDPDSKEGLLIDFGLSELVFDQNNQPLVDKEEDIVKRIQSLQTQMKIRNRIGTKGYMPPESLFHHL